LPATSVAAAGPICDISRLSSRYPESQGKRELQGELNMLGGMSWIHWLIVLAVVLLMFGGRGKITQVMGDFAKGINAFKKGLKEDDKTKAADAENAKVIEQDKATS
jgi:sec-independent protein translocase protein TatA